MISSFYTSLSGLNAFQKQLNVAANNLANVNTDGFKKSRALLESAQPQGVTAKSQKLELPGPLALEQTPDGEQLVEKSNVEVGEEIPNVIVGQRAYETNLKILKVADETMGSLLDIVDK
ncbi:MAG: flagellar basal body protein [Candidatus Binatia bacterium]